VDALGLLHFRGRVSYISILPNDKRVSIHTRSPLGEAEGRQAGGVSLLTLLKKVDVINTPRQNPVNALIRIWLHYNHLMEVRFRPEPPQHLRVFYVAISIRFGVLEGSVYI